MATNLTVTAGQSIAWTFQSPGDVGASAIEAATNVQNCSLSNGTGDNQADIMYRVKRNVDSGTPLTVDLASGTGDAKNIFGFSQPFAKVRAVTLKNLGTPTANDIFLGHDAVDSDDHGYELGILGASDASAAKIRVKAGGAVTMTAPIGAGLQPNVGAEGFIKVTTAASAPGVDFEFVVIGCSA
jgi:hypothetical protein